MSSQENPQLRQINQQFYDNLWSDTKLIEAHRFNTWPLIEPLSKQAAMRLEVGPGMRPRLPIEGTHFADISQPALQKLSEKGGICQQAPIAELPFDDNTFDLISALDIIEHVEDDIGALKELCRVAKPGAYVLISTPLYAAFWTPFDELVGHYRRYEPEQLKKLLADNGLIVEQSAGFGMKPKSSGLVDWGMKKMQEKPRTAMWVYNRILMPMGLRFQKPLNLQQGMADMASISDVFLVCRLNK